MVWKNNNDFNLLASNSHLSMNKSEIEVALKSSRKLQEDQVSVQEQQQKSGLKQNNHKKAANCNFVSILLLRTLIQTLCFRPPGLIG